VECKEVAAVINVGCCYNLLSDETSSDVKELNGFPMSATVGKLGLQLGRGARDLACQVRSHCTHPRNLFYKVTLPHCSFKPHVWIDFVQSADRWKEHHPTKAIQNFELHAFRAAFQLVR